MASVTTDIHPDASRITNRNFPDKGAGAFGVLTLGVDSGDGEVSIYIAERPILDALQAALDAIRADFDARELDPVEAAS